MYGHIGNNNLLACWCETCSRLFVLMLRLPMRVGRWSVFNISSQMGSTYQRTDEGVPFEGRLECLTMLKRVASRKLIVE